MRKRNAYEEGDRRDKSERMAMIRQLHFWLIKLMIKTSSFPASYLHGLCWMSNQTVVHYSANRPLRKTPHKRLSTHGKLHSRLSDALTKTSQVSAGTANFRKSALGWRLHKRLSCHLKLQGRRSIGYDTREWKLNRGSRVTHSGRQTSIIERK